MLNTLSNNPSLRGVIEISQQHLILTFWIAIGLAIFSTARYLHSPWRKLPPGPRGLPFLGNALQLHTQPWLTFVKWKQEFGDVFYLNAVGQPMVVLNTQKAAADLLDRRAGIYSDRPRLIVAAQILCGGLAIGLQSYGTTVWRRLRKAAHEGLNKSASDSFKVAQLNEAILLTSGLLAQPAMWDKHILRTTASISMSVIYDTPPIASELDSRIKAINDFLAHSLNGSATQSIGTKEDSTMFVNLFNSVREKLSKGIDRPSLVGTWIKDAERYPDVQKRAHEELDSVVGRTRIPTFSDFQHLPYIRAMVKEMLRWRPVVPLGIPHLSTKDDWYNGMFIPKGTTMLANIWQLNHDPTIYGADAADFNPARFLDSNGEVAPGPPETKEEGHVSYGFGRRACPGKHAANNMFFIRHRDDALGDEHGNVIPIDVDGSVDDGLQVHPVPFKADISPRFPEAVALLAVVTWTV
ncbi:cytochrome P450 [Lactarius psammicola]|nr:cytochrome P450 [Lactarius psammicola]